MALKVTDRIPYGNAQAVEIIEKGESPEIRFAAGSHGGPEALWFCFNVTETDSTVSRQKLTLTLKYARTLLCGKPVGLKPVYQPDGKQWFRMKSGIPTTHDDGQVSVSWSIPYPAPTTEIAFCYPYGPPELRTLVQKSKGTWRSDTIGLSQGGRSIKRLSNTYGKEGGHQPGLYLIARQHSGETPGSWVLDGLLEQFSRTKKNPYMIWSVPLANIDGVISGDYGKDNYPYDLNRAWGHPPMRHETLVIAQDMAEWKRRCNPELVIDFHAPSGSEDGGIYAYLPDPERFADARRAAESWANVIGEALGKDYASDDFKRVIAYPSRWETPNCSAFASQDLKVCSLAIETPYSNCGKNVMQQKQYREAGKLIAEGILRRKR